LIIVLGGLQGFLKGIMKEKKSAFQSGVIEIVNNGFPEKVIR